MHKGMVRVDSPSILPLPLATAYQMGGKSPYPSTPHTKCIATAEGEVNTAPTPSTTTPCRSAVKECMAALERPKAAISIFGGGPVGYLPPSYLPHPPVIMPCIGG